MLIRALFGLHDHMQTEMRFFVFIQEECVSMF